jgi:hypothetical protein
MQATLPAGRMARARRSLGLATAANLDRKTMPIPRRLAAIAGD